MELLILSDSHGHPADVAAIIRRTRPDGILHAGDGLRDLTSCDFDGLLWVVRGNCDLALTPLIVRGTSIEPAEEELFCIEGKRILLMHGHRYGVKSALGNAIRRAIGCEADALIFGHTHTPLELYLTPEHPYGSLCVPKPLSVFNPGSLGSYPGSFGTLTIRNGQMLFGHGRV